MSANLSEIVVNASIFPNAFALPVSAQIGDLEVQTNLEELLTDTLEITEHPIESGAAITDHSYVKNPEVVLRCGWSNSSLAAITGIIAGFFSGGTMTKADYVSGIYSQLLKLQQSREPFSITTSLRQYDNMLIRSLAVTRDQHSSQILDVRATCRQLIIVSTSTATLAPQANQSNPSSTAEAGNSGTLQTQSDTPSPGGSVPANDW